MEDELILYCSEYSNGEFACYVDAFTGAQFGKFANFFKNKSKWFSNKYFKSNRSVINPNEKPNFVNKVSEFIFENYDDDVAKSILNGDDFDISSTDDQNLPEIAIQDNSSTIVNISSLPEANTTTILRSVEENPEPSVSKQDDLVIVNSKVNALPLPENLIFTQNEIKTICSQMFNGQFSYLMNSKPKKNINCVVGGNKFSVVKFEFEEESWLTTSSDLVKKVKKPLANFTDSFDIFANEISERLFYIFPYELPPGVASNVASKFAGNLTELNNLFMVYKEDSSFTKFKSAADIVELIAGKIKNLFHARYQKIKACGWWPPKSKHAEATSAEDELNHVEDNDNEEILVAAFEQVGASVGQVDASIGLVNPLDTEACVEPSQNDSKKANQILKYKKCVLCYYEHYEMMAANFESISRHMKECKLMKLNERAQKRKTKASVTQAKPQNSKKPISNKNKKKKN